MKNNIFHWIGARRSLRGQILWSIAFSFTLALLLMAVVASILNQTPIAARLFFVPLIVFVASFLFFFMLFTRKIVAYTRLLADGLMLIAEGDLRYRVPISRQDELGNMAQCINHMAAQIERHMERERQAERSKLELITGLSHDLRTPLTSVIGYLNLIQNETFQNREEYNRFVDNAVQKTQQLKHLIDDLFEYTRLNNRDVGLSMREVDLKHLLKQMLYEFEPIAEEQGLTVATVWDADDIAVVMDPEKMARAVDNLLMNALKFSTKPGEVKVRLRAERGRALLAIENAGAPIDKEAEARLFDRFYKGEPSRKDNRSPSGSGLGLSIAKQIVELHHGRIWLEHRDGSYTFYIELPLAA
ncbi:MULTISPECIES: cell wall metabolism sensor histidine kinase WalK [unclassified Paenibacillus]|uniref:sensor histidine kinase n=1 Tax=unclassified Paenibacillus TaxID=185978 RepID=UPI001C0FA3CE|nr:MULTISPECIES: HAMP domain-containing sensor histidine kinase [unclassified Paenibacillus]MBU5445385.1 HAMP domain-containing histidine kinase [Paenibacillus sp. MSJ-34]CAH0121733.1 Adaptive-response sensory-kinase SasA [Paenibacillus sp. CECT 9249]